MSNNVFLNEYFIHGIMSNAYTLLIIYARIDLTPWYIVCLYCLLVVEEVLYQLNLKIGKLNGDLLQPSGIRYEVWSFSVRHLISIAYWKGLIFEVKLSVVVPQAIGISLRNRIGDSAGDVPCLSLGFGGTMCLIFLTCSLFLLVYVFHFIVCSSIDTPLFWFDPWFDHCLLCIRRFLAKSHVHMRMFGQNSHIHVGFWPKSMYTCNFLAKSRIYT